VETISPQSGVLNIELLGGYVFLENGIEIEIETQIKAECGSFVKGRKGGKDGPDGRLSCPVVFSSKRAKPRARVSHFKYMAFSQLASD
jgi:hypothetical protein